LCELSFYSSPGSQLTKHLKNEKTNKTNSNQNHSNHTQMYTPCVDEGICVAVMQTTTKQTKITKKNQQLKNIFKGKFRKKRILKHACVIKIEKHCDSDTLKTQTEMQANRSIHKE